MSEAQFIQLVFTVIGSAIGVSIGWGSARLAEKIKNDNRKEGIKAAIKNELKIVNRTLSYAKNKRVEKNEKFIHIPRSNFPFVTEIYDCLKIEIFASLKPNELEHLNIAYLRIKELNHNQTNVYSRGYILTKSEEYPFCYTHNIEEDIKLIVEAVKILELKK